jgi:hypothetical protein
MKLFDENIVCELCVKEKIARKERKEFVKDAEKNSL